MKIIIDLFFLINIFCFVIDEPIDFFIDNENPEDWDSSMINDGGIERNF
jgi:hypothetical protein